jgi:hypothetical protein
MGFGVDEAKACIGQVRRQFATTMPQSPREHTARHWRPMLEQEFEAMATLIRAAGTVNAMVWRPSYSEAFNLLVKHKTALRLLAVRQLPQEGEHTP